MLGLHPWQQEDVEIAQPVEVQLEPQRVNMVVIFVTSITSSTCGENFNFVENAHFNSVENAQPVEPERVNMVLAKHSDC